MDIKTPACASFLSILLSVAALGQPPGPYSLRGVAPDVAGKTYRMETIMRMENCDFTMAGPKGSLSGQMSGGTDTVQRRRITKVEGTRALEYETHFEKQVDMRTMTVNGREKSQDSPGKLDGMKLIAKLENGKWVKRMADGSEPTERQAKELANDDFDQTLYPEKPVAVGESWEVDAAALKKILAEDARTFEGKARCKLLKIEQRAGQDFAVISCNMVATAEEDKEDGTQTKMGFNLTGTLYRSLIDFVDVDVQIKGNVTMQIFATQGDTKTPKMRMIGPMSIKETIAIRQP